MKYMVFKVSFLFSIFSLTLADYIVHNENNFISKTTNYVTTNNICSIDLSLKKEIQQYQPIVKSIMNAVIDGKFKGKVYKELAYFVDKFGYRISGSKNLENSIDYSMSLLSNYSLENVHGEEAKVPLWIRGNEYAKMILPREHKMSILGLGGSISTPPDGITAEVLVVNSFDELHKRADEAAGKIIVYNQNFVSYDDSVIYREKGAVEAAKVGGVASLIRSVTPFSINSPHTGQQNYDDKVGKIPTACITVEDAQMLRRISDRGERITIHLYMEAHSEEDQISRNVIGELTGSQRKESVVLVSGHIDSWDVGQGVMDDGAGAFVSWFSVALLKSLGLRPRRTVRAVLWTAEEENLIGALNYVHNHFCELENFNLVMESDEGSFAPEGVNFVGTTDAACIIQEVTKLLVPMNATKFKVSDSVSSDIEEFTKLGVPGITILNKNDKYKWFHHTDGDTMSVLDSDDLDKNVAAYAAVAYVVADLSRDLPKKIIADSTN